MTPEHLQPTPAIPLAGHRGHAHTRGEEVADAEQLERLLREVEAGRRGLYRVALENLDLRPVADRLLALPAERLQGLVLFGGQVPDPLRDRLLDAGAILFPPAPDAPVAPYRGHAYTAAELFAGLSQGYADTPDGRAYAWFRNERLEGDAYVSLLRAIHDDSMVDALIDPLADRSVVGVMGGHSLARGTDEFAAAAGLGHALAEAGHVVLTGGGPGAMEAANLGALAPSDEALRGALDVVAQVPSFEDVDAWAQAGFAARQGWDEPDQLRSVGIPTWFYGHEPPNVFGQLIAKMFSNALREDVLLAQSTAGLVVLPGAAGTVQEIFQVATRLYYATPGSELGALVLVGREHWTQTLPAWPLLQALGTDRDMGGVLHLVDDVDEAADLIGPA
ncbi:LOG family protein [Kytococcus sedentarius]|uniref:LOG family protein n=1 Tax=Kytococcus sedentarius TaxID=1276 RepID=UPI0035BC064A